MKIYEFVYYDKIEDCIVILCIDCDYGYEDDGEFIYLGKL